MNDTNNEHIDNNDDTSAIDDVTIESYNDDIDSGELTAEDKIKRLRKRVSELTKEKQEYLDGWQRSKADFVNYKKREAEERSEFLKFAKIGMVTELIPVLDSFMMAFANKEAWEKVDQNWRTGVEYIHQQLMRALEDQGLTIDNPIGAKFDPTIHTSIGGVPTTEESKEHLIAEVTQVGYRMNGKIIRSPSVKVYERS